MGERLHVWGILAVAVTFGGGITPVCWGADLSFTSPAGLSELQSSLNTLQKTAGLSELFASEDQTLTPIQKVASEELQTLKFQHYFRGVEVIGSMAMTHDMGLRSESSVTNLVAQFDLDITPSISASDAVAIARSSLQDSVELHAAPSLKILPSREPGAASLTYWVEFKSDGLTPGLDVLVDAHSGNILAELPHHIPVARLNTYDASDAPTHHIHPLTGAPLKVDLKTYGHVVVNGSQTSQADASALRATRNAATTWNYYMANHGRDSFDDKGSPLVSIVHIGRNWANAFWTSDLNVMAYGDGDGEEIGDLTQALDVAGHEMTHGVVSAAVVSGSVKGLLYAGESGALNEAFADFFGEMIEAKGDWRMGTDIFLSAEGKSEGLRNLANPRALKTSYRNPKTGKLEQRPYPAHLKDQFHVAKDEKCDATNDRCYVHVNSTIIGHTAYKTLQAIGRAKTEKLFYTVLTHYLTPTSDFKAFRLAAAQACAKLYNASTCNQVRDAFAETGMATFSPNTLLGGNKKLTPTWIARTH